MLVVRLCIALLTVLTVVCYCVVLYMYCAAGDYVIFSKEMWISILHHVVDEHEWLLAEKESVPMNL